MARIQSGPINTGEHQRTSGVGAPLPNGIYKGIVVRTGQRTTNGENGSGVQVEVEYDITWPEEHSNRKFWDYFNVVNPSEKAAKIGIEALSDLAEACYNKGFVLEYDEQLMGREVIMELYIEKAKPYKDKVTGAEKAGKDKNKCGKYWHVSTNVEEAKKAMKEAKQNQPAAGGVQNAAPAGVVTAARPAGAAKPAWGGQKPASAPPAVATPPSGQAVQQMPPAQPVAQPQQAAPALQPAAAAPAQSPGNVAPWKRNKQ